MSVRDVFSGFVFCLEVLAASRQSMKKEVFCLVGALVNASKL
jgi:hypothetical protein